MPFPRVRMTRPRWLRRMPMAAWFALALLLALALPQRDRLLSMLGDLPLPRIIEGEPAARFTLRATAVDGDTLASGGDRLRLHGIDAPESAQPCERAGRSYACGSEARAALARILGGGMVSCAQLDTDQYGRRVVRCHNDRGADVAAEMVRQGWAVAFRRFSLDYTSQEAEARSARRGLWAGDFDNPADWRRRNRN